MIPRRRRLDSNADDSILVEAAQRGDREAMDALLRRHYDRIYAVCRRITNSSTDAADAAQMAMISIVRALPRFDGRSAFTTWAHRVATNAALDEVRRRTRRPVPASADADDHPSVIEGVADATSEAPMQAVVDRHALEQALAAVPDEFRLPLILRDVDDLDYAEIAGILGIPVGTVKSRIARGRGVLSRAFHASLGNHTPPSERPTGTP